MEFAAEPRLSSFLGARSSWLLVILLSLFAGCARRDSQRAMPQVAILRFENLSSDASLDWMGLGFAAILSGELQGSPQLYSIQWRTLHALDASLGRRPAAPGISTERAGALASGANQIIYGDFSIVNGVLRASAAEEDLIAHKITRVVYAAGPARDGLLPVAGALARQLGETRPFGTRNQEALRNFVAGLGSPDMAAASADLAHAVAADPDFGPAYVLWLDTALAQRDRTVSTQIAEQAKPHRSRFSALDRAQLDLDEAVLSGDFHAQLEARRQLAGQDPANPNHHRAWAEALAGIRDYNAAIVEFRRGLSIRPDDVLALNMMGYAAAYSGDLPTAIRVLRGYEQLRPNDPNPLDSLGDVHFALGRFSEAEQFYLAAQTRSPVFLNGGEVLKAAQARLMTGDVAAASQLFNRWLGLRAAAHDPFAPYHQAAWLWQTGARREALAAMERLAQADAGGASRAVACRAQAQLAVWLVDLGDHAGAADHARKAAAEAGPADAGMVALVASLTLPDALPQPEESMLNDYARAYGLLLAGKFQLAVGALEDLYRRPANDPDDGLAVLLAWAYEETGNWQRAEPLLRLTPLPQSSGLPLFSSLYFPRLFALRGAVLDRAGQHVEAGRYLQLFRKFSGSSAPGLPDKVSDSRPT